MPSAGDKRFADAALARGHLTYEKVAEVLEREAEQEARGRSDISFDMIAFECGYLDAEAVEAIQVALRRRVASCPSCQGRLNVLDVRDPSHAMCPGCGALLFIPHGLFPRPVVRPGPAPSSSADATDPLASRGAGFAFGHYKVYEKLGEGGNGVVYRAVHQVLRRIEALKILRLDSARDRNMVQRFVREAQTAGRLDHPHIVHVYDVGEVEGTYFIALEYVDGRLLFDIIADDGALPVPQALEITRQIASALQHAYEHHVVHRDLKPENVLIDRRGAAKVVDLGLAKDIRNAGFSGITGDRVSLGTIAYVAPEQVLDARFVDHRADLYSLGATLYFLLTRHRPHESDSTQELIKSIVHKDAPSVRDHRPGVSEGVARLVAKLLSRDVARRHQTPAEVLVEIDALRAADPDATRC
ncbi:MAG: serine/threonine protein kinase [Planctomycetes bacterium]|nr:serine/threonine protein kinase [Planctomycetota bacterium]